MSENDERATVRPVTLARIIEMTHACADGPRTTADLEAALNVSHRRARETILEALRIGLIREHEDNDPTYTMTHVGEQFLEAVRAEGWERVDAILETRSPHYGAFLDALEDVAPASLGKVLTQLKEVAEHTPYAYNQTSVEVVGDWAERLGVIQRNAFTGRYYPVLREDVPSNFPYALLSVYDDLEETAGVDLQQRYLSIPELRETFCEREGCPREAFDSALQTLAKQNVGRIELSGAPMDTEAKDAKLGIKGMELSNADGLVSTSQSTEQVMAGVEQYDKQYYYLVVYDRDLTYSTEATR